MTAQDLLRYISAALIVLVALAGLSVYIVDSVTHHTLDNVTQALLTFVTGVIATLSGVHMGSSTNASGTQAGADITTQAVTPLVTNGNGTAH